MFVPGPGPGPWGSEKIENRFASETKNARDVRYARIDPSRQVIMKEPIFVRQKNLNPVRTRGYREKTKNIGENPILPNLNP